MKSILLPVDQNEQMPAALETAHLLANVFGAAVEGVALRPAFAEIVAPDPIVAVTIPPADWNETEFCRGVRQVFDAFAARHSGDPSSTARFRWRGACRRSSTFATTCLRSCLSTGMRTTSCRIPKASECMRRSRKRTFPTDC